MKRALSVLTITASFLCALPAFAADYEDALACSAFMDFAASQVPPDKAADLNALSKEWKKHAWRLGHDSAQLDADLKAAGDAQFAVLYGGTDSEKQATFAPLGERCQTLPDPRTSTYPDAVCGRFAQSRMNMSEESADFYARHAKPGGAQGSAEEIAARRQTALKTAARARSIVGAYNRKTKNSPDAEDYGIYGDMSAAAMLDSCAASLGVD